MEVKPNIFVWIDLSWIIKKFEKRGKKIVEFFRPTYINDQLWEISFNVTILQGTIFLFVYSLLHLFSFKKNFLKEKKKQQKEVAPIEVIANRKTSVGFYFHRLQTTQLSWSLTLKSVEANKYGRLLLSAKFALICYRSVSDHVMAHWTGKTSCEYSRNIRWSRLRKVQLQLKCVQNKLAMNFFKG